MAGVYISRRGVIRGQLTRFATFVDAFSENQIDELKERLTYTEGLLSEFNSVQLEIETLVKDEVSSDARDEFESKYYRYVAKARALLATQTRETARSVSTDGEISEVRGPELELQKFNLPTFTGEYSKWFKFKNTFESLIANNAKIDNAQKFYRLQECIKGDAETVIDGLEDFNVAWDLLRERYEDKPGIVQNHLKDLLDLPVIQRESVIELRKLVDNINKHTRALKSLDEPVDQWDRMLILLMSRKLDKQSRDLWEQARIVKFQGIPKFENFSNFILERCKALQAKVDAENTLMAKDKYVDRYNKSDKGVKHQNKTALVVAERVPKCLLCKGQHYIYFCNKFVELTIDQRREEIKRLKLCLNCLRSNHYVKDCQSRGCKWCKGRHNSLLHSDSKVNVHVNTEVNQNPNLMPETSTDINLHCREHSQTLLSTAVILVLDKNGAYQRARCLLDSGSQPCFMTRSLVKRLGLKTENVDLPVSGFNQLESSIKARTQSKIKSVHNNFTAIIDFLILDEITNAIPCRSFEKTNLKIPANLNLADPEFNVSGTIDILLGASIFFDLLCVGQIKLGTGLPILQKSLLGWIISGQLQNFRNDRVISHVAVTNTELDQRLELFWHVETDTPKRVDLSGEELDCERKFVDTIVRDADGKFIVTLPTRDNLHKLGESLFIAEKRFKALERKFKKCPQLKQSYTAFMKEYESLGHMTKISKEELEQGTLPQTTNKIFYLPHHGVINESSETTKLRVVFDGSCKSDSNISLNDVLQVGAFIQDDLFSILCRFRTHKIVITSDIAKMYRMINVTRSQQDLQRILWRDDENSEISHFRLNTVTYGTGPASFLAMRCLYQISLDIMDTSPEIARIIQSDFYMDDLITGGDTVEHVSDIAKNTYTELAKYGFQLRKWNSNNSDVLDRLSTDKTERETHFLRDSNLSKTLGILWQSQNDVLEYRINIVEGNRKVTKRSILSTIAKIFDILGLIGPVIVKAKLFMQRLWQLKVGWDESLPYEIVTAWKDFESQLPYLNALQIPRTIGIGYGTWDLHGFSDASEKAYGACIYVKTIENDNITIRLVCSKSRVAPLKPITLPRLELCGAVLLANLMKRVIESLNNPVIKVHYWCDSTIVLSWIAGEPNCWKQFVANRVNQIQTITDIKTWRHVGSKQNPADIISRGIMPKNLEHETLWWNGPKFLYETSSYEVDHPKIEVKDLPEIKRQRDVGLTITHPTFEIIGNYSSLGKLQRVMGWCLRFISNVKKDRTRNISSNLSIIELDSALNILIKTVQMRHYSKEYGSLAKGEQISQKSHIRSLSPFMGEDGLIRVGGRLRQANIDERLKHPILLPGKNNLMRLIIRHEHAKQLHAGPQSTLAAIRQRFWPINGKREVKNVISKCIVCFRCRPRPLQQSMGDLPADRIIANRPFLICGTDFAGPFYIKDGRLRNRSLIKAYMCIFICFATKACHIEVVSDLSTHAFLNSLKRFIARRGLCEKIYSDNGKNYVGASNYIKEIRYFLKDVKNKNSIAQFCRDNNMTWQFIPASSPHQGGIWEAAVKSAKYHATRIVGKNHLTFEELSTVFAQIESVLNSRPLTEMSSDPNDLYPLTPGHFLIGSPLNSLPEADSTGVADNRLPKYELLKKLIQHFWTRWSKEYLSTLQKRSKWFTSVPNIKIGTLVILKDEDTAPLLWRLGRITDVHPGKDNLVRVVSVRTTSGILNRSVQKICPLPIDSC